MRTASVTNCAAMSWPTSQIRMRWWLVTRPALPREAISLKEWPLNSVAAPNRSKIVRSGSFSPISAAVATRCSTGNSIFPADFLQDRARCEKAGIPETVSFQTKCELARAMMERLHQAQIPVAWVVADTVYGNNLDLRTWVEGHHYWFALAVASTEPSGVMTAQGRKLLTVAQAEQRFVNEQEWRRFSVKTGTKGPLLFERACLPILHRRAR